MLGMLPAGCGQCLPCRVNRRRQWASRMFLESLSHAQNCFVTLTYDELSVDPEGSLVPRDFTLFLKRLRKIYAPLRFRFFMCGEYGDETWRPHFHFNAFGLGLADAPLIEKAWSHGLIKVGDFNMVTANYVAQYVTKKMTQKGDWRLDGRHPEYARMSNRPGIGAISLPTITKSLRDAGLSLTDFAGDVPTKLTSGIFLGRYLRRKLQHDVGMTDEQREAISQQYTADRTLELSALLQAALKNSPLATAQTVAVAQKQALIWRYESQSRIHRRKTL